MFNISKWHGKIGFHDVVETAPSIWEDKIVKVKEYSGDILSYSKRYDNSQVNTDVTISNRISIISDPYTDLHVSQMAYVEFNNVKWCIQSVDIEYPRLILNVGEVYKVNE